MGVNTSFPDRLNTSSKTFSRSGQGYVVNENETGREKKRKASKFATLRKKLTRVRRHSRSLDHGKIMREMLSSFSVHDVMALVQEYETTGALKELYLAASLARPSAHSLRQDLAKLYDYKFCTDVDLIYKNSCFPAHRSILCVRSPFFKALLSNYPEYGAQVPIKLKTPGVDVELFSALIRYLYTEELGDSSLNLRNNELLGRLAGEFGVPNVLEHDLKMMLDNGEYSDAVLVFSTDSDHCEMSSSYHYTFTEGQGQAVCCEARTSRVFEFHCHKAILASRSPFFRNLIIRREKSGEEITERTLRTPTRIVLDESVIPKRYARVLLNALYQDNVDMGCVLRGSPSMCSLSEVQAMVSSGRCQMTIIDEAMELYQIGQFLDTQIISQGCEDIIIDNLTVDCLLNILNWSDEAHGSKWVYRQAMSFLIEEFAQLSHSQVLMEVGKEHLKEALASDFLQSGEADILSSVVSWGEYHLIKRIEEREPNLLSHTAHSIAKKGVKKRDLNDSELKEILSELLPLVRKEHILPSNSEALLGAVKRGLIEWPAWHTYPDDAVMHRIGAWTGVSNSGTFTKPRLFTPFYEEAKNILEDMLSQGSQSSGNRVRTVHMSAIPDTLYMLETAYGHLPHPYSGSPVSTVDIIAGTIPVPDRETFMKMLDREEELMKSKAAQRTTSLICSDKRTLAANAAFLTQLRVVREFGLPDNAVEVLQNSQSYFTSNSYPQHKRRPCAMMSQSQREVQQPLMLRTHQHCAYKHDMKRSLSPSSGHQSPETDPYPESALSDVMPDIAMASAALSQVHLHEETEQDFGTHEHQTLYI